MSRLSPSQRYEAKKTYFLEQAVMRYSEPAMLAACVDRLSEEQLDEIAETLDLVWCLTDEELTGAIQPAEVLMTIHIGDTIKLAGRNPHAASFLQTHGYWWKVKDAYHHKASPVGAASSGRPPSWFLQSLPPNKQGGQGIKVLSEEWLRKDQDPNYRVVEVCVYPTEFKYSNYKE